MHFPCSPSLLRRLLLSALERGLADSLSYPEGEEEECDEAGSVNCTENACLLLGCFPPQETVPTPVMTPCVVMPCQRRFVCDSSSRAQKPMPMRAKRSQPPKVGRFRLNMS